MERPVRWWQAQAARIPPGHCPKCRGYTPGGEYIVDVSGESRFKKAYRAVVERCKTCGWMHAHMTQEQAGPIEKNNGPRSIRPIGVDLTDDEVDRVASRAKVVRLPGQPLKPVRATERERYRRRKKLLTNKGA